MGEILLAASIIALVLVLYMVKKKSEVSKRHLEKLARSIFKQSQNEMLKQSYHQLPISTKSNFNYSTSDSSMNNENSNFTLTTTPPKRPIYDTNILPNYYFNNDKHKQFNILTPTPEIEKYKSVAFHNSNNLTGHYACDNPNKLSTLANYNLRNYYCQDKNKWLISNQQPMTAFSNFPTNNNLQINSYNNFKANNGFKQSYNVAQQQPGKSYQSKYPVNLSFEMNKTNHNFDFKNNTSSTNYGNFSNHFATSYPIYNYSNYNGVGMGAYNAQLNNQDNVIKLEDYITSSNDNDLSDKIKSNK